ncbi:zf-TFIIB domain-containing protein [Paenibacillus solisilvae]|uniref:Zf-TFIIB domain-containing protein n=1 Tax=Paenibacillus solisilvae TaxID=2486751 RepID=A0ABW0W0E5_9BACL
MKCPVCENVRMREVEKDNVLIDVCPDCKGMWLDRGELDKLMLGMRELRDEYERMEQHASGNSTYRRSSSTQFQQPEQSYSDIGKGYTHGGHDKQSKPYRKKKTMFDVFGDLFD